MVASPIGSAPTGSESRQTDGPRSRTLAAMDEATALLLTLADTAPDAPTACVGWAAHELVAHLAAGAAEMAALVEDVAAGRPSRPTQGFAEREAPFRALADEELRARLLAE